MLKDLASRLVNLDVMQVDQIRFGGGEYVTLFDLLFLPSGQLDHFLPQVLRLPDSVQQPFLGLLDLSVVVGSGGAGGAEGKGRGLWRSSSRANHGVSARPVWREYSYNNAYAC